jgi:hypothetical protein
VICEEAKHGMESIAETVADREALRYRNTELPMQRRVELGIPPKAGVSAPGGCGIENMEEVTLSSIGQPNAMRRLDEQNEVCRRMGLRCTRFSYSYLVSIRSSLSARGLALSGVVGH